MLSTNLKYGLTFVAPVIVTTQSNMKLFKYLISETLDVSITKLSTSVVPVANTAETASVPVILKLDPFALLLFV